MKHFIRRLISMLAVLSLAAGVAAETAGTDPAEGGDQAMKEISVTDIQPLRIGQTENAEAGTGCTVLICETGMRAGADIRGGGPASRETPLLNPLMAAQEIHAIVLAGGSAFGLGAANGVMNYLEEKGFGYDVGVTKVPLVAQSDIFDLTVADAFIRPDAAMGYEAARLAFEAPNYRDGNYGAGCGATVGKIAGMATCMKSGIGSYAVQIGELKIGAVVVVNALGDVYDWKTGRQIAGLLTEDGKSLRSTMAYMGASTEAVENKFTGNTTLAVIVTNADFDKTRLCKIAGMAQDGMARSIRPVHTSADGDTVYAVSVGDVRADQDLVGSLAAEVLSEAITLAVYAAESAYGYPCASDLARLALTPSRPEADRVPGPYEDSVTVHFGSEDGCAVWYVINDETAKLPADGVPCDPEEGLTLDEGDWQVRAVSVRDGLVSEEWSGQFLITFPRPHMPRADLAPGTYGKTQDVRLAPGRDETDEVTIYYTVDGSAPDADSPVYDGTPIRLPNGRSTLQAVAVNGRGKAGNVLEVSYRIDAGPLPAKAYTADKADMGSVKLGTVTYASFAEEFGPEESRENVTLEGIGDCVLCRYGWGYVICPSEGDTGRLVEICYSTDAITAPRDTAVGMRMEDVLGKFRDMGQVESPSGNRGLYAVKDGTGKICKQENGGWIIRYTARDDGHEWHLDYSVGADGIVTSVCQRYIP